MNKIQKIKDLTAYLNRLRDKYYNESQSLVSDFEYDRLYDELESLEKETGFIMANSPTVTVGYEVKSELEKVEHTRPMLSAKKTKDVEELKQFIGNHACVVSWKEDGCFSGDTRITMADGTQKQIKNIVPGDMVMSFDDSTKKVSPKKVVNVYNNGKKELNDWVRIKLFSKNRRKNKFRLLCTKNHLIFSSRGWIEAGSLSIGDTVFYYDYILSKEQESFLLGIGLGDGWFLKRHGNNGISNSEKTLEFHYSKVNDRNYDIMISHANQLFSYNFPKISSRTSGYGSEMFDINLHTIRVPDYMYNSNNQLRCGLTFTKEVCSKLSPLSLAILYIDDGSKCPSQEDGYDTPNKLVRCMLAVNRHRLNEVIILSDYLNNLGYENNYVFEKNVVSNNGDGYKINFTVKGTEKLFDDIAQYIPKEIRKIKLGLRNKWQEAQEYKWWDCVGYYGIHNDGEIVEIKNGFVDKEPNKIRINRKKYIDSYDLEIEDNHTYFANRYAVHNCTAVLRYKNGKFIQAISRGNGEVGEDITHTMRTCKNIPLQLPYVTDIEVRGECLISYKDFDQINKTLPEDKKYANCRNLASGSVRQLDANIAKDRNVQYKAFELVQDTKDGDHCMNILESFEYLKDCGFDVVEHKIADKDNIEEVIDSFNPENYEFAVDGLIIKYNDFMYGQSLGRTSHHSNDMMALKWKDEEVKTEIIDIDWTLGKTGIITPTAVFKPIELEGTIVERASLHNLSIMQNLTQNRLWYKGMKLMVYKANMIIPNVSEVIDYNEFHSENDNLYIPSICPVCGGLTEVIKENDSEFLFCSNPDCKGKLLGKLTHAVSRNALNIDGLSEQTLEKFINLGWLTSIEDIYHLAEYKDRMIHLDGFGKKSVEKLLSSIEKSRETTLQRLLYSLSIPLIGKSASKAISQYCKCSYETFTEHMALSRGKIFLEIDDFGEKMWEKLDEFWSKNCHLVTEMVKNELKVVDKTTQNESLISSDILAGKTFCVTGTVVHFKNRKELEKCIEEHGGKLTGSVTSKTSFLINNDQQSSSSKNQNARKFNIPIINEEEFLKMIS